MSRADPVKHISPRERIEADPTPGVVREQAIAVEGLWAGMARTQPAAVTAWHHHGDHQTSIYVVEGYLKMESGPGGKDVIEAGPDDFLYVPPGAIHRESNPGASESHIIVARAGHGPPTTNVEGPA